CGETMHSDVRPFSRNHWPNDSGFLDCMQPYRIVFPVGRGAHGSRQQTPALHGPWRLAIARPAGSFADPLRLMDPPAVELARIAQMQDLGHRETRRFEMPGQ